MSSSVISANGELGARRRLHLLQRAPRRSWFSSSLGLLHAQAHEAEARALGVEDHDQDDPVADELDVDVAFSPSWNWVANSFSPSSFAMPPVAAMLPGGQRRERGGVEVLDLAARGDELPVLVDEEDDLGVRVAREAIADPALIRELLLVHHQAGIHGPTSLRVDYRYPRRIPKEPARLSISGLQRCGDQQRRRPRAPETIRTASARHAHSSRRPARARARVAWSAYSRSAAHGDPLGDARHAEAERLEQPAGRARWPRPRRRGWWRR